MSKGVFKPKKPGDPVVMKLLKEEEQLLIDWINMQTTSSDSIRFLIQKEIALNGMRDLQKHIPQIRDIESLRALFSNGGEIGVTTSPVYQQTAATIPAGVPKIGANPSNYVDSQSLIDSDRSLHASAEFLVAENLHSQNAGERVLDRKATGQSDATTQTILDGNETSTREPGESEHKLKRSKRKTFDKATIDSYNV